MKRTVTGLCVAGAFAFAATLGAQSGTSTTTGQSRAEMSGGHDVTVTGCLAKSADGSYMLTNARMDTAMGDRSGSTGTTASTTGSAAGATATGTTAGTPTGTAVTGGATVGTTGSTATPTNTAEAATAGMGSAMTWMLQGGTDLDKHVGHKVQVTGRTSMDHSMMNRPGGSSASATTTAPGSPTTTTAAGSPTTTTAGTTTGTSGSASGTTAGTTGSTAGAEQRTSGSTTATDKDAHSNAPRLDVQSVKMIASSCS